MHAAQDHAASRRFEPMVLLVWGLAAVRETDLAADQSALQRGLSASLSVEQGSVRLQPLGAAENEAELTLRFEHPLDSDLDQQVTLQREGEVWNGTLDLPAADHWRLVLQAGDGSWRLDGELRGSRGIAVLAPRFGHG